MADIDFSHTAEMMKAALPYVDVKTKVTIDMFSKLLDFMGSLHSYTKSPDMAACGFKNQALNLEGLLSGIRPLCSDRERTLIDRILNIFNMKKMFETYSTYMNAMNTMQGFNGFNGFDGFNMFNGFNGFNGSNGFPFGSAENSSHEGNPSGDNPNEDHSSHESSHFDIDAFFQQLQNNGSDTDVHTNEIRNIDHYNHDIPTDFTEINSDTFHYNNAIHKNEYNNTAIHSDFNKSQNNNDTAIPLENSDNKTDNTSTPNGSNNGNNNMVNMLKSMIPPEQMGTFENLSMLFNTMSYDGNRKLNENGSN